MSKDPPCGTCGHPQAMGQCWRLTCPRNGGSMRLVAVMGGRQQGKTYATAERASAEMGREVRTGFYNPPPRGEAAVESFDRDWTLDFLDQDGDE